MSGRAVGTRRVERVTALATGAAGDRTTATTATTGVLRRHAAAATTARSGVRGYRDVSQGQGAGVVDAAALGHQRIVAAVTTVACHHAPGNHQAIEGGGGAGRHLHDLGAVLAVEGHVGDVVVIEVAIDGDVPVDHQHLGQGDGHAGIERDDVAVLRRAQGSAQRTDTRIEVVGGGPGGQAPLVFAHGGVREHVGAFDIAGGDLKVPVAPRPVRSLDAATSRPVNCASESTKFRPRSPSAV